MYFVKLHTSIQYWKLDRKDIKDILKLVKEFILYFLYKIAQTTIFDKILYSWEKINQMKKVFRVIKYLINSHSCKSIIIESKKEINHIYQNICWDLQLML